MSDCLQNEDSIVSDLSLSSSDTLTGILDSGNNVNSEISIEETMVSSVSDGDSTDSNLGDDGSLYSELSSGGSGGIKYTGQETDSIVVNVDNNVYTISASLKPIKFDSVADFPLVGSEKLIYVDFSNKVLYGWDSIKGVYYKLVADVKIPTKLSEFTNDAGFITNTDLTPINESISEIQTKLDGIEDGAEKNTVDSVNGKTGAVVLSASDVSALPNTTNYGASLDLTLNTTDYKVTVQLKDQSGNNLGEAKTIDLPLESVVVSGRYDDATKKVVLTLQNDTEISFSVADLVSGLQTQITVNNKLSSDLVSDTNSINKFVTEDEKTTWNNKVDVDSDNLTNYYKKTETYTKKETEDLLDLGLGTKADKSALDNYVTNEQLEAKGYLTEVPDDFVTESELSSSMASLESGLRDVINKKLDDSDLTPIRENISDLSLDLSVVKNQYLKSANIAPDGKTLVITKQDDSTVSFKGGAGTILRRWTD